jgi:hypothetical protein
MRDGAERFLEPGRKTISHVSYPSAECPGDAALETAEFEHHFRVTVSSAMPSGKNPTVSQGGTAGGSSCTPGKVG